MVIFKLQGYYLMHPDDAWRCVLAERSQKSIATVIFYMMIVEELNM